jgi:hypothetical protein
MGAFKTWKMYGAGVRVDSLIPQARQDEIQCHNEEVRQNREILKTITEAVLYLSRQELAFRGHDESEDSFYACLTISAGNDLRNLMFLIMLVLPYRLVMTSGINVPYYACLTISAGNDLWNLMCRGNYRELLESFAKFDSVFEWRLHGRLAESERGGVGGGRFNGVSPEIQNDLINCRFNY